jgi:hypothetical protein
VPHWRKAVTPVVDLAGRLGHRLDVVRTRHPEEHPVDVGALGGAQHPQVLLLHLANLRGRRLR